MSRECPKYGTHRWEYDEAASTATTVVHTCRCGASYSRPRARYAA